jgi:hypothetical protein
LFNISQQSRDVVAVMQAAEESALELGASKKVDQLLR